MILDTLMLNGRLNHNVIIQHFHNGTLLMNSHIAITNIITTRISNHMKIM